MKKEFFYILAGLVAIFSFALVSTAQAGALTSPSTTPVSSYGGRLDSYSVSFALATQNDNVTLVHLIFPSGFGMPGAAGAELATGSIVVTPGTLGVTSSTVTAAGDGITLNLATSTTHVVGTTFEFSVLNNFLNPYTGGSLTLGIETRTFGNAVIDNASTTAFTIVSAPEKNTQVVPSSRTVVPPTSKITGPTVGASIAGGQDYSIKGTAVDQGLYAVSKVEVSVDGGSAWSTANLTKISNSNFTWEYVWANPTAGEYTLRTRATDSAGNTESPATGVMVTVVAPAVSPTPSPTPTPTPTPSPASEKPISEMTASELQTRITQLQQQLVSLLQQLVQLLSVQL